MSSTGGDAFANNSLMRGGVTLRIAASDVATSPLRHWAIGERVGKGYKGTVFRATPKRGDAASSPPCVIKIVPVNVQMPLFEGKLHHPMTLASFTNEATMATRMGKRDIGPRVHGWWTCPLADGDVAARLKADVADAAPCLGFIVSERWDTTLGKYTSQYPAEARAAARDMYRMLEDKYAALHREGLRQSDMAACNMVRLDAATHTPLDAAIIDFGSVGPIARAGRRTIEFAHAREKLAAAFAARDLPVGVVVVAEQRPGCGGTADAAAKVPATQSPKAVANKVAEPVTSQPPPPPPPPVCTETITQSAPPPLAEPAPAPAPLPPPPPETQTKKPATQQHKPHTPTLPLADVQSPPCKKKSTKQRKAGKTAAARDPMPTPNTEHAQPLDTAALQAAPPPAPPKRPHREHRSISDVPRHNKAAISALPRTEPPTTKKPDKKSHGSKKARRGDSPTPFASATSVTALPPFTAKPSLLTAAAALPSSPRHLASTASSLPPPSAAPLPMLAPPHSFLVDDDSAPTSLIGAADNVIAAPPSLTSVRHATTNVYSRAPSQYLLSFMATGRKPGRL